MNFVNNSCRSVRKRCCFCQPNYPTCPYEHKRSLTFNIIKQQTFNPNIESIVMLLSCHRNVPIRAVYLLLLTKANNFFCYIAEVIATPEPNMQFP